MDCIARAMVRGLDSECSFCHAMKPRISVPPRTIASASPLQRAQRRSRSSPLTFSALMSINFELTTSPQRRTSRHSTQSRTWTAAWQAERVVALRTNDQSGHPSLFPEKASILLNCCSMRKDFCSKWARRSGARPGAAARLTKSCSAFMSRSSAFTSPASASAAASCGGYCCRAPRSRAVEFAHGSAEERPATAVRESSGAEPAGAFVGVTRRSAP